MGGEAVPRELPHLGWQKHLGVYLTFRPAIRTLRHMANQQVELDRIFAALGNETRRGIVARLVHSPATVGELAEPLAMSLPSVMQHLQVLQDCGLVTTRKVGRSRTCSIATDGLRLVEAWLSEQRTVWERHLDRLGDILEEPTQDDQDDTMRPDARGRRQ